MIDLLIKLKNRLAILNKPVTEVTQVIPDAEFYAPLFSPWLGYGAFGKLYELSKPYTLVSPDRCYILYQLVSQAIQLNGHIWECGVYKGGTSLLLAGYINSQKNIFSDCKLHLFDTFAGMPSTDQIRDIHKKGDFSDTSLEVVRERIGYEEIVRYHPGFIPDTFSGMENEKIAFAHIDVDIYKSVLDCCEFIMPRMIKGGFIIFDDYGFPSCPGARLAVDEFFADRPEKPLVLPTGQAVVYV